MRRRVLKVKETELREQLYPLVEGQIFHVTRRDYLSSILGDGGLKSNETGTYATTFGPSESSFFRRRGCVSLFDLVHPTPEQIQSRLPDCWPFQPAAPGSDIAILILAPRAYQNVITWDQVKTEGSLSERILPYLEAGYPDFLPLSLVDELIEVEVEEVTGSIRSQFRAAASALDPKRAV